jgi:hypothetical protein
VNRSPTVEELKLSDLGTSPPPLVRSTTRAHPLPVALDPDISYEDGELTIRAQRTPLKYQPLESIANELPDAIQEIVCNILDSMNKKKN